MSCQCLKQSGFISIFTLLLQEFWENKEDDMDQMRTNMGNQLKDLTKAVSMGQKYLDDFVSNNQISEAFYK